MKRLSDIVVGIKGGSEVKEVFLDVAAIVGVEAVPVGRVGDGGFEWRCDGFE